MLYLFAVILPPIALLGAKKPFQAIFCPHPDITISAGSRPPSGRHGRQSVEGRAAPEELIEAQRLATEAQTAALRLLSRPHRAHQSRPCLLRQPRRQRDRVHL